MSAGTPTPPPTPPGDREALAAEHALGVLEGDAARLADELMETDPAFATAVWEWRERLSPLAARVAEVEPDPATWRHIAADLDRPAAPPRAAPREAGGTEGSGSSRGAEVIQLRRSRGRWRATAIAATALAAAAAVLLVVGPPAPEPPPVRFVAVLSPPEAGGRGWVAAVDTETRQIALVPLDDAEAPEGRAQELWYIEDQDTPPRSLGLISDAARLPAPAEALEKGGTLAVSLEPPGGSPTGQPTGPVVLVGELKPAP